MKKQRIVIFVLCLLVPVSAFGAPAPECRGGDDGVGIVDDFKGVASDYRIVRQGRECRVQLWMTLMAGDRISVLEKDGWLRVQFVSRRQKMIRAGPPVRLKAPTRRRSLIENIAIEIIRQFSRARDRGHEPAGMRGEGPLALRLTGLDNGAARIAAGKRHLAVGWRGGTPQYTVRFYADNRSTPLLTESRIQGSQLVIRSRRVRLSPGDYLIRIIDGRGKKVEGRFTAVDAPRIPDPPADLAPAWVSREAKQVIAAYWLAGQENGRWAYEAYLRVATLSASYGPAKDLMYMIASRYR